MPILVDHIETVLTYGNIEIFKGVKEKADIKYLISEATEYHTVRLPKFITFEIRTFIYTAGLCVTAHSYQQQDPNFEKYKVYLISYSMEYNFPA